MSAHFLKTCRALATLVADPDWVPTPTFEPVAAAARASGATDEALVDLLIALLKEHGLAQAVEAEGMTTTTGEASAALRAWAGGSASAKATSDAIFKSFDVATEEAAGGPPAELTPTSAMATGAPMMIPGQSAAKAAAGGEAETAAGSTASITFSPSPASEQDRDLGLGGSGSSSASGTTPTSLGAMLETLAAETARASAHVDQVVSGSDAPPSAPAVSPEGAALVPATSASGSSPGARKAVTPGSPRHPEPAWMSQDPIPEEDTPHLFGWGKSPAGDLSHSSDAAAPEGPPDTPSEVEWGVKYPDPTPVEQAQFDALTRELQARDQFYQERVEAAMTEGRKAITLAIQALSDVGDQGHRITKLEAGRAGIDDHLGGLEAGLVKMGTVGTQTAKTIDQLSGKVAELTGTVNQLKLENRQLKAELAKKLVPAASMGEAEHLTRAVPNPPGGSTFPSWMSGARPAAQTGAHTIQPHPAASPAPSRPTGQAASVSAPRPSPLSKYF